MHPMPGRRVSSISLASWTPLADIGNTERILAVLAGGRLLNGKSWMNCLPPQKLP